jgi:hypothetical protein
MSLWIWMRERVDVQLVHTRTAMVAESNLVSVRENIDKNKQKTVAEQDALMGEIRQQARACRGGSKEQRVLKLKRLLPQMQRFKRFRQQTALASQQLSLLDVQINAFESGRFQKEMTDTLRASVVAMKKVGIKDDDMDTVVMDIEETIQQQNELSDSLNMSVVNTMDEGGTSDEMLMRELMALAGDDDEGDDHAPAHVAAQATGHGTAAVPAVPAVPAAPAAPEAPASGGQPALPSVREDLVSLEEPTSAPRTLAEEQ